MQDANFENLLLKDNSWNVHNIHSLLIEIYKPINNLSPPCFEGSLIWNTVLNKIKNIDNIEDFKEHIKKWKPTTCSFKLCL